VTIQKELSTKIITIDKKKYFVMTEDFGFEKHFITTTVYLGGEIISKKKIDYKNILKTPEPEKELGELMKRQHELSINKIKKEEEKKSPSSCLDEIQTFLQKKQYKKALKLLNIALELYPNEPLILSYCGCLEAILNKNYTHGIEICSKAIKLIKEKMPYGHEFYYPVLYLNLGRTYLASGNKKYAVEAFQKGLIFDDDNKDLLQEIKRLGLRRKPIVRFLPRSHPINKYIGVMLHRLKNT
jgi:tetratricopeptide (TPR) repeat protein